MRDRIEIKTQNTTPSKQFDKKMAAPSTNNCDVRMKGK